MPCKSTSHAYCVAGREGLHTACSRCMHEAHMKWWRRGAQDKVCLLRLAPQCCEHSSSSIISVSRLCVGAGKRTWYAFLRMRQKNPDSVFSANVHTLPHWFAMMTKFWQLFWGLKWRVFQLVSQQLLVRCSLYIVLRSCTTSVPHLAQGRRSRKTNVVEGAVVS